MPQQPVSGARGLDAGGFEQRDVGVGAAERFLVAVAVQQRLAADRAAVSSGARAGSRQE